MNAYLPAIRPAPKRSRSKSTTPGSAGLPTPDQLALSDELARRWRLTLPAGYGQDAGFVRAFLDVFALDGRRNPPDQVLRRLRNARQLAWDGLGPDDIARKLELPACLGPVLHAYGLAQVPRSWRDDGAVGERDTLVDRLTEHVLAGEDGVWAEFKVSE